MNALDLLKTKIVIFKKIVSELESGRYANITECMELFADTLIDGRTIFWCGNGGSASESSHLAAELIGRFKNNRKPFPSISLASDLSVITCIANDFGYKEIFSRQLEGLAKKEDLLVILSTSGNSENILQALMTAKNIGVHSIALLGKDGGQAKYIADHSIIIDSNETARIQEVHLFLGHTFCEYAELKMGLV